MDLERFPPPLKLLLHLLDVIERILGLLGEPVRPLFADVADGGVLRG